MKNCGFFIGVCDFDNILKEDEVFVQIQKEDGKRKLITGNIIVTKNPCLSPYDVQKVKGIEHPYFNDMFFNVIVFPAKGKIPLPSKITGSDLDGDVYWVCWEKRFLHVNQKDYDRKPVCQLNNQKLSKEDIYFITKDGKTERKLSYEVETFEYKPNPELPFTQKCLGFHKFFHSNYKLPEVNKTYLSLISNLSKYDKYKNLDVSTIKRIESLAYYHSIEVDFQKAGISSTFFGDVKKPTF